MSVCVIEGRVGERMNDPHDPLPANTRKGSRARLSMKTSVPPRIMFLSDENEGWRAANSRVQINVSVVNAPQTQRSVVTKIVGRVGAVFTTSIRPFRDLMSEQPLSRGLRRPSRS